MSVYLWPILLLVISNIFMTYAWYGHMKQPHWPLAQAILISWLIAGIEYCFAVPANRLGAPVYSLVQLKTMQEIITLIVFAGFVVFYFGEPLRWNHLAGFACLVAAAGFIFYK